LLLAIFILYFSLIDHMNSPLPADAFDLLHATNTPTIANAIERLGVRGRMEGFTRGGVKAMFPDLGVMLGYAVTVRIRSAQPPQKPASLKAYWDQIASIPAPRVVVVQDLDQPSGGAWWGEVNSNIHRALGCLGVVTDGTVRDLDEVRPIGFHFLARGVAVSHGFAFPQDFSQPVTVDGMNVKPGDLIHADKHGAITIPVEHARALLEAVAAVERYERPMIQLCKSQDFSAAKLDELRRNQIA
jgi:4-hydroxy-4-methyl-2-oxoglutarate aldolase